MHDNFRISEAANTTEEIESDAVDSTMTAVNKEYSYYINLIPIYIFKSHLKLVQNTSTQKESAQK